MHLIKLDATGSTNDYLKDLARRETVEDFTVVTAEAQTSGRGQRGSVWTAEPGKNLTMSIFCRLPIVDAQQLFALNAAVALSIAETLDRINIPQISVKWPNDIMSAGNKIGGILIENNVKTAGIAESVIGIGLNVNQSSFEGLPKAGSLFTQTGQIFDKQQICADIVAYVRSKLQLVTADAAPIWRDYNARLFRIGKPTAFQHESGAQFMGMIVEASKDGTLCVKVEDDSVKTFGIKQIQMLY